MSLTCSFLQFFPPFAGSAEPLALEQGGESGHLLQTGGAGCGPLPTSPRLRPGLQLHRHRAELRGGISSKNITLPKKTQP